jgi:hypothetical protein
MESGPKLLDQVRHYMRLHHYSIHSERSYCDWIRRFARFQRQPGSRLKIQEMI